MSMNLVSQIRNNTKLEINFRLSIDEFDYSFESKRIVSACTIGGCISFAPLPMIYSAVCAADSNTSATSALRSLCQ